MGMHKVIECKLNKLNSKVTGDTICLKEDYDLSLTLMGEIIETCSE
jgi:hypothetical protein